MSKMDHPRRIEVERWYNGANPEFDEDRLYRGYIALLDRIDDLQAANTAEVERRRKAEAENAVMREHMEFHCRPGGHFFGCSGCGDVLDRLDAIRESTEEKAT